MRHRTQFGVLALGLLLLAQVITGALLCANGACFSSGCGCTQHKSSSAALVPASQNQEGRCQMGAHQLSKVAPFVVSTLGQNATEGTARATLAADIAPIPNHPGVRTPLAYHFRPSPLQSLYCTFLV